MLIKSSSGIAALAFTAIDRSRISGRIEEITVKLSGPAEAGVTIYDNHLESLATYFRDLADHWRGWKGTKSWESLEGQLSLAATADRTGHITLRVQLVDNSVAERWRAEASLLLDAGLLDQIAKDVAHFLTPVEGAV